MKMPIATDFNTGILEEFRADRLGDEDVTERPAAVGEVDLGDVPA